MKLSMGPILTYWPRQRVLDFYAEIAILPVDIVYLGETLCARRHELRFDDWIDIAGRLADAGKEAVLSTQTLLESEGDLKILRKVVGNGRFKVEANDMGAVRLLAEAGVPFVAGPTLNVFNGETLRLMAEAGATRWVMPPEAGEETLAGLLGSYDAPIETEVFAHGFLPLAYSARCYTARRFNLQKDTCGYRCIEFPDGMAVTTREGQTILRLNGTQTLSSRVYDLLQELPRLVSMGVAVARISPQAEHTADMIGLFRRCLDGVVQPRRAWEEAEQLLGGETCNGFWHGRPGLEQVMTA